MSSYLQPVFGALTDPGRSRDHNEDRILAGPLPAAQAEVPPWFVFAVADGVGGQQRGDWASETTIAILMEDLAERLDSTPALDALRGAFTHANSSIWSRKSSSTSTPSCSNRSANTWESLPTSPESTA